MGTSGHSLDTFNIADLTPEQQRILIEIRRRKTELLLEIQFADELQLTYY
ncbi:unnamed protein product [Acanthoscelides obtectus]|uniref:Uncharacterized protein n=1 Tax=Acanthoscelides obtectus TaxID=200917 RepID=A0A9P0NZW9_ACAOB|nr:unnamed protein product [Acanthoscelides obtectus]CAK1633986.1 hypothetical protein AOBTE_LOCUS8520 [Acanthoscelides obtectus]